MDLLLKQLKVLLQERNIPSGRLTLVPKNPYEIVIIPKREEEFIWGQRKKHIKNVTTLLFLGGIMRFTALLVCALFCKNFFICFNTRRGKGLYKNKLPNFQIGVDIDPDTLRDRSKEINPQRLLKQMDTNSTKFKEQYGELKFLQSKEAEKHAKEAKEYSNSKSLKI